MIQPITLYRNSPTDCSHILQALFRRKPELRTEKSLYVYCTEVLDNRLEHLEEVYPEGVLHAIAIKTNNLPQVLRHIVQRGHGLEAASFEEVKLAAAAGCPPERMVFDSPVKTMKEIERCEEEYPGMYLNANCFAELDRLKDCENLNIGIRVNPLVDIQSPGIFNVSTARSKFGIPISQREKIQAYAQKMENVCGLHVHAGSEIGNIHGHVEAIGVVYDLAEAINANQAGKIKFLDIGGGFPARMQPGEQPQLDDFMQVLQARCPQLFSCYQVITEYGRFVHAHSAFAVSHIEYILPHCEPNILLIHVGADLFPREIYSSHPPHHDIALLSQEGGLKPGKPLTYDIGGPLCFSGDFLGKDVSLPPAQAGDWVLVADVGANTLSMWSGHCSRERVQVVWG